MASIHLSEDCQIEVYARPGAVVLRMPFTNDEYVIENMDMLRDVAGRLPGVMQQAAQYAQQVPEARDEMEPPG